MKKSAKVSLAMALMLGLSAGAQMVAPQNASAEISDKFRLELNGVYGYRHDPHGILGYAPNDKNGRQKDNYWNNYTRVVLSYNIDKNVSFHTRLHSGYDAYSDYVKNTNEKGTFFDQTYMQLKMPKAAKVPMTLVVGKKGGYMGQGMVFNSTGNLTGGQLSFGNWWEPTNATIYYGDRESGDRLMALDADLGIAKNLQLSFLYAYDKASASSASTNSNSYIQLTKSDLAKLDDYYNKRYEKDIKKGMSEEAAKKDAADYAYQKVDVKNGKTSTSYKNRDKYYRNEIISFGMKAKTPGITFQGEYAHNLNGASSNIDAARKGWYVEAFTGPTSDMTSGLPVCKPGTNVWSVKYQDLGKRATISHNPTFVDDYKGWRITYGHTFKKGLAADISVGRMKDKGSDGYDKGKWSNLVVAEMSFKLR